MEDDSSDCTQKSHETLNGICKKLRWRVERNVESLEIREVVALILDKRVLHFSGENSVGSNVDSEFDHERNRIVVEVCGGKGEAP